MTDPASGTQPPLADSGAGVHAATLAHARALDAADELRGFRDRFRLPTGVTYLDGNSLGALPVATPERIGRLVAEEWGDGLVRSWNRCGWIESPTALGGRIARLLGARPNEVVVTDSTSVNVFKLVVAALALRPGRTQILSEAANFPTDLYVCAGAARTYGHGARLVVVPRERIAAEIGADTAVVVLTHVHYKTGEILPMAEITAAAHACGALVVWDLSHSAGAVALDLGAADADFAVGCGYKYLNGGPGAPSFLYVATRHQQSATNPIWGWHGHAAPFAFDDEYVPAPDIRRFLTGTPSIVASAALEVGVELLLEAGVDRLVTKSRRLTDYFIATVESLCNERGPPLLSPRAAASRGSQVAFSHPHAYEIVQALIDRGVIGDFRAPDAMRFGFPPLYTRFEDAWVAADALRSVLDGGTWRQPRFAVRAAVT